MADKKVFLSWINNNNYFEEIRKKEAILLQSLLEKLNISYYEKYLESPENQKKYYSFLNFIDNYQALISNSQRNILINHRVKNFIPANFSAALKNYLRFFPDQHFLAFEKIKYLNQLAKIFVPTNGTKLFLLSNKIKSEKILVLPTPIDKLKQINNKEKEISICLNSKILESKKLLQVLKIFFSVKKISIYFDSEKQNFSSQNIFELENYFYPEPIKKIEHLNLSSSNFFLDLCFGFKSSLRVIQAVINNIPVLTVRDCFKEDVSEIVQFLDLADSEHFFENISNFFNSKRLNTEDLANFFSENNFTAILNREIKNDLENYENFFWLFKNKLFEKEKLAMLPSTKKVKAILEQIEKVKKYNKDLSSLICREISAPENSAIFAEKISPDDLKEKSLSGDSLLIILHQPLMNEDKLKEILINGSEKFSYLLIIGHSEFSPFESEQYRFTEKLTKEFEVIQTFYFGNPEAGCQEKELFMKIIKGKNNKYLEPDFIVFEGSQFQYISLSVINREIEFKFIESERTILSINQKDFYEDLNPQNYPEYHKLIKYFSLPLLKKNDFFIRHSLPNEDEVPASGYYVLIFPWEFGFLPEGITKHICQYVDQVWCPSVYVKKLHQLSGIPEERIRVIPNGINPTIFNPQIKPFQLETKKQFRILFNGGLIYRKGIDILLKAYTEEFSANDDVCLVIKAFGQDTYYREEIIDEIKKNQKNILSPEVLLLEKNFVPEEMGRLYTSCQVYAQPYRAEGFCLPLLEAMACGLPVITTGFGPSLDFCDFENSFLLNFRLPKINDERGLPAKIAEADVEHLKLIMRRLYENPNEAWQKGQKAQKDAQAYYWENIFLQIEDTLSELKNLDIYRENWEKRSKFLLSLFSQPANLSKNSLKSYLAELETISGTDDYLLARADIYYFIEYYKKALELYAKLLKKQPFNQMIREKIGEILIKLGDQKTAEIISKK